MNRPKMILFDYGGTLLYEPKFDLLRGERAVFRYIKENPQNVTPEQAHSHDKELFENAGQWDMNATNGRCSGVNMNPLTLRFRFPWRRWKPSFGTTPAQAERCPIFRSYWSSWSEVKSGQG